MAHIKSHKLFFSALAVLLLLFSGLTSTELIKNQNTTKENEEKTAATESGQVNSQITGDAKAEVKIENKTKSQSQENNQQNSSNAGTCTVTKNGVTTIVPADEVNINEKSSGDITVKVDCENSTSQKNGNSSNKTSIKNNIKIDVESSP